MNKHTKPSLSNLKAVKQSTITIQTQNNNNNIGLGGYTRISSPPTYYSQFNKNAKEQTVYNQTQYPQIFTWKQNYQQFTEFNNDVLFNEKMKERSQKKKKQNEEDDAMEQLNLKLMKEKQLFQKTDELQKLIQDHNKNDPKNHMKKVKEIKKNNDIIDFIDNKQRRFFSTTKAQMQEINKLQKGKISSQQLCKESMDRKGLALRMVLSSIPLEKLQKLLYYKQIQVQQIMDKLVNMNKKLELRQQIFPKFKLNWEIHNSLSTSFISKRIDLQSGGSLRLLKSGQKKNVSYRQFTQQKKRLNTTNSKQTIKTEVFNNKNNTVQLDDTQIQRKLVYSVQLEKRKINNSKDKSQIEQEFQASQNKNNQMQQQKDQKQLYINLQEQQPQQNSFQELQNLYQNSQSIEQLRQQQGKEVLEESNSQSYIDNNFGEKPATAKESLRFKKLTQIQKQIKRINSQNNFKGQQNQQDGLQDLNQLKLKPLDCLNKFNEYLDKNDQEKLQLFKNIFLQEDTNNFFDFKKYFYHNYSKKNKGLDTHLSFKTILQNQDFDQNIVDLIKFTEQEIENHD